MAPRPKVPAVAGGVPSLNKGADLRKKGKSSAALDGLVVDLYERVHKPLEAPHVFFADHLAGIRPIHRLLVQIQKHERPLNAIGPCLDGPARMELLSKWLADNGIQLDGLRFEAHLPEGAGVVATKKFAEGELLSQVPGSLMMSTYTALRSPGDVGLLALKDPWFRAVPSLILAMHLLFEKHRSEESPSKWKGYIASLPGQQSLQETNIDGPDHIMLPLAFSMDTIEAMNGTTALAEFHKMLRTVAKQYCRVRTALIQLAPLSPAIGRATSWFTFAEFRWAVSIVMMRQNQIPVKLEGGEVVFAMALIPVMDMVNHEEGPLTSHYNLETEKMELTAKRDFLPGEQLFMSYGTRPSTLLLLYSGFLPSTNALDRIRMVVDLPSSDPLFTKKLGLLKWLEISPTAQLDLFWDGSPSPDLARWLQVAVIKDEAAVTKAMRAAIAARAEATANELRAKALAADEARAKETSRYVQVVEALAKGVMEEKDEKSGGVEKGAANGIAGECHVAEAGNGVQDHPQSSNGLHGTPGDSSPAQEGVAPNLAVRHREAVVDRAEQTGAVGAVGGPLNGYLGAENGLSGEGSGPGVISAGGRGSGVDNGGEVHGKAPAGGESNGVHHGHADKEDGVVGVSLSPEEAQVLLRFCEERLSRLRPLEKEEGVRGDSTPAGLGLGMGVGQKGKDGRTGGGALKREMALVLAVREKEIRTLECAIARCRRAQQGQ